VSTPFISQAQKSVQVSQTSQLLPQQLSFTPQSSSTPYQTSQSFALNNNLPAFSTPTKSLQFAPALPQGGSQPLVNANFPQVNAQVSRSQPFSQF
jgi:hypothetical protein